MTARFVFRGTLGLCYSKIRSTEPPQVGGGSVTANAVAELIQNARAAIDDALAKKRLPHRQPYTRSAGGSVTSRGTAESIRVAAFSI